MTEAGHGDGLSVVMTHYFADAAGPQAMSAMLKEVGINTEVRFQDRGQFLATSLIGDYEGMTMYANLSPYDPDEYYINWKSGQRRNDAKVNDPEVDRLLELQREQLDPEERQETWEEFQKYVLDKAYYTFGPAPDARLAVNPKLQNWKVTPFYLKRFVRDVHFA